MEDAAVLGRLARAALVGQLGVGERLPALAVHRLVAQADAARPGVHEQLGRAQLRLSPEVGDADDRELEALGGVDRHEPHRLLAAELDRRLRLARVGLELGQRPVDEAADVAPVLRLVGGGEPDHLRHVGQAPHPAGEAQHVLVVAAGGDAPLEQRVEAQPRGALALGLHRRRERREALALGRVERRAPGVDVVLGEHVPEPPPGRPPVRGLREQRERVGRGAGAERRRERAEQRDLVAGVGDRAEVGAEVLDLLAGPEAAPAGGQRGEPLGLQRPLEEAHVGRRAHQHHHVGGPVRPVADERADAPRQGGGLPLAQLLGREPALLLALGDVGVDEQQLGAQLAGRLARRGHRPVLGRDHARRGVEHLGTAAEVARERGRGSAGVVRRVPLLEDRHVGVAEAVDRLQLVADEEHVVAVERVDELQLQPVGVLELVDHDALEAPA